ncbi:MAG: malto-oligosyltrehalose trehalohydrolase, partial [Actinomycetota bacterium]|nr:malto-oligosyltrehalose trehalohydrolase [Actinomycetota bacterium]
MRRANGVWAPRAERVEVVEDGQRRSLPRGDDGWFTGIDLPPGTDYMLSLDGGDPRPDPRSRYQPEGVDGPSRVVDPHFDWTDDRWRGFPLHSAVIYELHVGTFTPGGTLDRAIERLDHLVGLGVNAVELMPVAEFSGDRGWGYDGVDLYAVHHAYGGPDALRRFVDACHARGLAVILDVVYNHLGPAGNYLREFGPYFTDKYGTPWGEAVNLDDRHADEVRAFFIDNALMWLRDYHFDGLRLDAVHAIVDTSAVHFLEELGDAVRGLETQLGRTLWVIAESDLNDPRLVWRKERGGYGLDAQWSDDFHHALHAVLTGERSGYYSDFGAVSQLADALRRAYVYDGRYSAYRQRRHGRPAAGLEGFRFLGYLQNHDQIGNRARGDRSSALMAPELLKVAAALVMTSPFVPMLFMGEEWGASTPWMYFTDHRDPELGRAVSDGRKREFAAFGWDPGDVPDPQDAATFERSKLRWDELEDPLHADLLDWHRRLIRLRREIPALTNGRMDLVEVTHSEDPPWLVMRRGAGAPGQP